MDRSDHKLTKGGFSVRSAYRMLVATKIRREAWLEGSSGSSENAKECSSWSKLWKTGVPSKVRVFLWRLAHCSLPTADVRHHRSMAISSTCALCGADDSCMHSLLICSMARCVWALSEPELVEHMLATAEPNPNNWIFTMLESVWRAEFTKVVVTLWAIWSARQKLIHEGEHQSPMSTHMFINRYLDDLQLAITKHRTRAPTQVTAATRSWVLPPAGFHKLNVDAAVDKNGHKGSISVVCCNEEGLYAGSSPRRHWCTRD
jgi:hypothetical protein